MPLMPHKLKTTIIPHACPAITDSIILTRSCGISATDGTIPGTTLGTDGTGLITATVGIVGQPGAGVGAIAI